MKKLILILCAAHMIVSYAGEEKKRDILQREELKEQLKSIRGKIKVYSSFFSSKYSEKNRSLIRKKMLEDAMIIAVITASLFRIKKYFSGSAFILNAIPIEDIQRKASDLKSTGDAIRYSSMFRQGCFVRVPGTTLESNKTGLFSRHNYNQSFAEYRVEGGGYIVTYELGEVGSNNYIRARVSFAILDRAFEFVERMNRLAKDRGLEDCKVNTQIKCEYLL